MAGGRPTDYDPGFCASVIEYGAKGKSRTWIAATLGCSRQTLHNWEAAHPEFLDAMDRASLLAQLWWEDSGQDGMAKPGFNAAIWSRSMAARFPDEWREKTAHEHGGKDGAPISFVDVSALSPAQIKALASVRLSTDS